MESSVSIVEWYQNETIFLTGGSGFIGKGVIFKLLKCGTPKIYVLIRTKKGQNPDERLDIVANHWIYDTLRAEGIDVRSKLIAIAGDVTVPHLGISEKDRLLLQQEVTVVIHAAASVRFDDPLKTAVFYNLRSARDLVELAKGMKHLKVLNHVSTAFCNIDRQNNDDTIFEKVYPPKMNWRKLIEFVETTPDELVTAIEAKAINGLVNSYLFTKHLAEKLMEDAANDIPVVITRPPIVMGSLKEPQPGWVDNLASATALMVTYGKGMVRTMFLPRDGIKAYSPLDVTVNLILSSSCNQALQKKGIADGQLQVFNQSHELLQTTKLIRNGSIILNNHPMRNALWAYKFHPSSSESQFLLYHFIMHLIPGVIFDTILKISGNKPRLLKLYRKLYIAMINLAPIMTVNDKFDCANHKQMITHIHESESEVFELNFPRDEKQLYQWHVDSINGFRKFLGDPIYPTPGDLVHQKRLYWLDVVFQTLMVFLIWWVFPLRLLVAWFLSVAGVILDF